MSFYIAKQFCAAEKCTVVFIIIIISLLIVASKYVQSAICELTYTSYSNNWNESVLIYLYNKVQIFYQIIRLVLVNSMYQSKYLSLVTEIGNNSIHRWRC